MTVAQLIELLKVADPALLVVVDYDAMKLPVNRVAVFKQSGGVEVLEIEYD